MHQFTIYKTFRKVCPHPSNNLLDNASVHFVRLNHKKNFNWEPFSTLGQCSAQPSHYNMVLKVHTNMPLWWMRRPLLRKIYRHTANTGFGIQSAYYQQGGVNTHRSLTEQHNCFKSTRCDHTERKTQVVWFKTRGFLKKKNWRINIIEGHHKR